VKKIVVMLMMVCLCFASSCKSKPDLHDIPLTEGEIPYILPPGTYIDIDGVIHVETKKRWSISEADLYNYVSGLNDPVDSK